MEETDLFELLKKESSSLLFSVFGVGFCSLSGFCWIFIDVVNGLGGNSVVGVVIGVNFGNSFCNNGFVNNGLVMVLFKLGGGCNTLGLVINFDVEKLYDGGGLNASKLGILNVGAPFGNKNGFSGGCWGVLPLIDDDDDVGGSVGVGK